MRKLLTDKILLKCSFSTLKIAYLCLRFYISVSFINISQRFLKPLKYLRLTANENVFCFNIFFHIHNFKDLSQMYSYIDRNFKVYLSFVKFMFTIIEVE